MAHFYWNNKDRLVQNQFYFEVYIILVSCIVYTVAIFPRSPIFDSKEPALLQWHWLFSLNIEEHEQMFIQQAE